MDNNLGITFHQKDSTNVNLIISDWVTIQQELIVGNTTDFGTIMTMLSSVTQRKSAIAAIYEACKYVKIEGDKMIVTLTFYVWPSRMDLQYNISSSIGVVSEPTRIEQYKSFNIRFDGTSSASLPYVYEGDLTFEMPIYDTEGVDVTGSTSFNVVGSIINASDSIHTVIRANGKVTGYEYTVEMVFDKTMTGKDNKISDVNCEIAVDYHDANGEWYTIVEQLDIPKCVSDLLEYCPEGRPIGSVFCAGYKCDGRRIASVYYSTCKKDLVMTVREETND